jgi:hypothetical protein
MKLLDIHRELVLSFDEKECTLALISHRIHELKTARTILADEDRPGRPSIDNTEMLILKAPGEIPFSSV